MWCAACKPAPITTSFREDIREKSCVAAPEPAAVLSAVKKVAPITQVGMAVSVLCLFVCV